MYKTVPQDVQVFKQCIDYPILLLICQSATKIRSDKYVSTAVLTTSDTLSCRYNKMPVHSKFYELLPEHYGYVLLSVVGSMCVNIWMGMKVGKARKEFGIKVIFVAIA